MTSKAAVENPLLQVASTVHILCPILGKSPSNNIFPKVNELIHLKNFRSKQLKKQ